MASPDSVRMSISIGDHLAVSVQARRPEAKAGRPPVLVYWNGQWRSADRVLLKDVLSVRDLLRLSDPGCDGLTTSIGAVRRNFPVTGRRAILKIEDFRISAYEAVVGDLLDEALFDTLSET